MGIPDVDTATKEALGGPKAALTDVMRQATERAGLNPGQWDIARNVASAYNRVKGVFNDIAGYRLGNTDQFTPGAKEQTAFNRIDENLQSPSALEPFTHHTYPDLYRRGAFGAYLSRLGLDPNGQFRAEYVAKQLDPQRMDPNVLDILTQRGAAPGEAGGAPTNAGQTFRDLATVGKNTVTPTSRFGLSSTLGVGATLSEALKAVGKTAALPATFLTSRVLESPTMKDAMLGRAAPVANDVFGGMARAGAIENQKRR
jgi:hypothetical protein